MDGVFKGMEVREQILQAYLGHLREHGEPPKAVYPFCRSMGMDERTFFGVFASLDAVESEIWRDLILRVSNAVMAGPEWGSFSARQQMLTFLFAFLEESLGMRSVMLSRFGRMPLGQHRGWLDGFESAHRDLVRAVLDRGRESGEVASRGLLENIYPKIFQIHLRAVIDYHLRDSSPGFERTDAFVEKSTNLAFDAIGRQALDSAIDLARFLVPQHWSR